MSLCDVMNDSTPETREAGPGVERLDQKRDNRFVNWERDVSLGEIVISASRSGGSFDPLGTRKQDVWKADDLVAVVDALKGRWVLLTLTINRDLWTSPEAAYQRCNERVRKVMAEVAPSGVWFAAMEVQTKTGKGWPHWHVVAWVPDDRSPEDLKRAAVSKWTVRTESVDRDTGEVTASVESIGFCDVQEARERRGVGRYIAKYIVKPWDVVPNWMGESTRRFRKMRFADATYDVLERLHRHERQRGSRPIRAGTGRRTRALFDRMARSGSHCNAFRRLNDAWEFVGTIPAPLEHASSLLTLAGGRPVRLGPWAKVRYAIASDAFTRLHAATIAGKLRAECHNARARYVHQRRIELEALWDFTQEQRSGVDAASLHEEVGA